MKRHRFRRIASQTHNSGLCSSIWASTCDLTTALLPSAFCFRFPFPPSPFPQLTFSQPLRLRSRLPHRQWAAHSYAIALVFIAGRFVLGVTGWEALGVEIAQTIVWACLALSVVLADLSIPWKEFRPALTVPVRSGVASKYKLRRHHLSTRR